MIRVGTGFSDNLSLEKAILEASAKAIEHSGLAQADTLLVYSTFGETTKWPSVLKKLRAFTGTPRIVGSSGYGVLTEETEIEQRPGAAVMAFGGARESLLPFLIPHLQENNFRAGGLLYETFRESEIDPSFSILLPDAFSFQHAAFFDGFESEGGFTPLIGGCASEAGGEDKTLQWKGDQITFDSVAGLAFGKNFEFEIGITQSCQPLGEPFQVTRSQGNVIFEMEGRPAYDIFLEQITQLHFEDNREVFHRLFLGLPIVSFQTEFTRSRYLVRNIMGVNPRKGVLACASQVEQGDYVTFAVRDPLRAKQDLILMLEDLQHRADGRKPLFGLYFNCCARGVSLYGSSGEDTALLREYFPGLPIIGFFTFGEIAPLDYVNHLHHYSGILTLAFQK